MNKNQSTPVNKKQKNKPLALATEHFDNAMQLYKQGNYAEAEPLLRRSLLILKQQLGPEHHIVATGLNNLAELLIKLGNYDEAEALMRHCLRIREQQFGPDHRSVAASLNNLALLLKQLGNYAEAEPLCRRCISILEQQFGPDHPDVAAGLNTLSGLLEDIGNYVEAEPLCRRTLKILEQQLGPNHLDVATLLNNLAGILGRLGNYAEAEQCCRRSLKIREQQLGTEHLDVAASLNTLAGLLTILGNYVEAERISRRSLKIREQQLGADHPNVVTGLSTLAALLCELGNYAEAELLYQRSLSIMNHQFGSDHQNVAACLNNLATMLGQLGNYAEAETLYRRSINILKQRLGPDHLDVAASMSNLAELLRELGNYIESEPLYRRSLKIQEEKLGLGHPDVAASLNNLAAMLFDLRNFAEMEPLLLRSLKIREEKLGLGHPDVAASLNNLAAMFSELGNYDKAEPLYRRSLKIKAEKLGPSHPDVAATLNNLAELLLKLGNYTEAELLCRRSLSIFEQQLGPNHPTVVLVLDSLAKLFSEAGRLAAAILCAKRGVNILQKVRRNVYDIDTDQLSIFDKKIETKYDYLANLLVKASRYGEAEYVMGMLKEKALFELVRRDQLVDLPMRSIGYTDTEAQLTERFDILGANLFALGQREEELKKHKERTPVQDKELAEIRQRLQQTEKEFNRFLDTLHDALPAPDITRVDDYSYRMIDLTGTATGTIAVYTVTAEDTFHTVMVTPHGRKPFSTELKAEELAKKILYFRKLLNDPEEQSYLSLAKELYNIIIRPMEGELVSSGIDTILWLLNGPLRLLPLSVLHDGERFVLEKFRNVCITTMSRNGMSEREPWNGLGMGVTMELDEHKALPAVKDELEGIIRRENNDGIIPGEILLNEQFTREAMESRLDGDYKAVHIASHFELNPVNETLSYLLLGDGNRMRMDELRCNTRLFKGVDLVAFSACSTGLGTASTRGREVDGIGYLCERQGAQTVLATLWPVEDKSTSMLMREFYRLRESGLTKAESLQKAQLALLNGKFTSEDGHDFTHPYFWAPFIMIGNGT